MQMFRVFIKEAVANKKNIVKSKKFQRVSESMHKLRHLIGASTAAEHLRPINSKKPKDR